MLDWERKANEFQGYQTHRTNTGPKARRWAKRKASKVARQIVKLLLKQQQVEALN